MQVGETYALRWTKGAQHLLDATIIELRRDYLIAECDHRCSLGCYLQQMRRTLPLHGTRKISYEDFGAQFVRRNLDAIALGLPR